MLRSFKRKKLFKNDLSDAEGQAFFIREDVSQHCFFETESLTVLYETVASEHSSTEIVLPVLIGKG